MGRRPRHEPATRSWDNLPGDEALEKSKAGQTFLAFLIDKYRVGDMTATTLCTICHLASEAGIKGPAVDFAMKPGLQPGRYQRHLDRMLGLSNQPSSCGYQLDVPVQGKFETGRSSMITWVRPAHELLEEEFVQNPSAWEQVISYNTNPARPPAFTRHPIVLGLARPTRAVPLAVFIDGVPYHSRRVGHDSVVGCWVVNLATSARRLVASLRKADLCCCGCKHWCSMAAMWFFVRWCLESCGTGLWPSRRHDLAEWRASDNNRSAKAGQPLSFVGVLLYLKCDLGELAPSLGIPAWRDEKAPCLSCPADHRNMYDFTRLSLVECAWGGPSTHGEFIAGCSACQLHRTIETKQVLIRLCRFLVFHRSTTGPPKGLVLTQDFPELALLKGDRVEPTWSLQDIGKLFVVSMFPFDITFWRSAQDTKARHLNPIFDTPGRPPIGITIQCIASDALHCLYLGVFKFYVQHVVWCMLLNDWWRAGRPCTLIRHRISVLLLRAELWRFYGKYDKEHPKQRLTRVGTITLSMLGTSTKQNLKTKGHETWGLVLFVVDLLKKHPGKVHMQSQMLRAGNALVKIIQLAKAVPPGDIVPVPLLQEMFDCMKVHLKLCKVLGIEAKPKHHQFVHLILQQVHLGSFRGYWNFKDEADNRELASIARSSHRMRFHSRVFDKLALKKWARR